MPFNEMWRVAAPAVRAALARKRCNASDLDDVMSITSERAWRTKRTFDSVEHFVSWCCTVASNVQVDEWRKTRREVLGDLPPTPTDDPEELALARVNLSLVRDAIDALPLAEREAIQQLESLDGAPMTGALRASRHRARAKLRALYQGVTAAYVRSSNRIGRVWRHLHALRPEVVTAAAVLTVGVLGRGAQPDSPTAAIRPTADRALAIPHVEGVRVGLRETNRGIDSIERASREGAHVWHSNSPLPAWSVPSPDRSGPLVTGEPSPDGDSSQHVCFATVATPYECYKTPFESIDRLFDPPSG